MARDLLVLGALHHDVVVDAPRRPRRDETLIGTGVDYRFGGKGGNQAVAAARMGASVAMAGRVGADAAAEVMLAALDQGGVDRSGVTRGANATGMSVAITEPSGAYSAVVVSGANLENDGVVAWDRPPAAVLIQNEVPEAANRALIAALSAETLVLWNAAPMRAIPEDLIARVDWLIVNSVEARDLTGKEDPNEAVRATAARQTVVTLGGDGLIWSAGGPVTVMPAFGVEVVSTHGAGDMFCGAFAAELLRGTGPTEALRFAQAAAALFVAAPIAARAQVTAVEVRRFLGGQAGL